MVRVCLTDRASAAATPRLCTILGFLMKAARRRLHALVRQPACARQARTASTLTALSLEVADKAKELLEVYSFICFGF